MSLLRDILESPSNLAITSKYLAVNGIIYMGGGALLLAWPGAVQTLLRDAPFVGHEEGLMRVIGMTLWIVGWYVWLGGRSGLRQPVAASVVDRLVLVPLVAVSLAIAGVFPHLLLAVTALDVALALGAWVLLSRSANNA